MPRHDYEIISYAGPKHPRAPNGEFLLHTWHVGTLSRDIELDAYRERMKCGEVSQVDIFEVGTGKKETLLATPTKERE